ncbi:MAG TPA: hypothetical protein DDW86_09070 [Clostridiales bacterium]|nr:hypothetical protein [Clostridiales bacterium]
MMSITDHLSISQSLSISLFSMVLVFFVLAVLSGLITLLSGLLKKDSKTDHPQGS